MTARALDRRRQAETRVGRLDPTRLAFLAAGAITIGVGVAVAVLIGPQVWAVDADRNLRAAIQLRDGGPMVEGYLYTPLAAALTVPATFIPPAAAILVWLVAKVGLVVVGVRHEAPRVAAIEVAALSVAAALFVPVLHDLLLGNVSVVVTAAIAAVAWSQPKGRLPGVALGIVLATVPKPQLIAFLVWMAIYRRTALLVAIATAAVLTIVAGAVLGFDRYSAFVQTLFQVPYLSTPMHGNLSLGAMLPPVAAVPLAVLAIAATAFALWRGELPGLVATLALGVLVAPYTMAYSAAPLLLAVRPFAASMPKVAGVLAITASIAVVLFLPAWAGAVLGCSLFLPASLKAARATEGAAEPASAE